MINVIGVRFRTAGKIYFFSPGQFAVKQGDYVIVGCGVWTGSERSEGGK